ncbi:MAG: phospholipase D family protein [Acetobacteraceae bacterium]|nr:phospholipase D family protein [Acetobacteraceae bacterium]
MDTAQMNGVAPAFPADEAPPADLAGFEDAVRDVRQLLHGARTGAGLVPDGISAFALRALAARKAVRSLDLQYYIWRDDFTGRLLAREILAAADRGLRVRLLLDDVYVAGADRTLAVLAAHPSIEVRIFNAASWRRWGRLGFALEMLLGRWRLNRRMHDKLWLADGVLAILGGRNIGNEYFDASGDFNFRDLDLIVAGEAAADAVAIFERYWRDELARPVESFRSVRRAGRKLPALRRLLRAAAHLPEARPFLERVRSAPAIRRILAAEDDLVATDAVQILADPPEKATGDSIGEGLADAVHAALGSAEREVLLISPYFVPGERGLAMLTGLARRGVRISVVTNSLAATDVVVVHGGYARYRRALLEAGVELYELKRSGREGIGIFGSRGASLHTKAFAVDGELIFVGSFNLDPRSAKLNTEMGGFVRHPVLGERMRAEHDRLADPGRSYRVTIGPDGRLAWTDVWQRRRRVRHREPDASLRRRMLALAARILPIESQL